MKQNIIRKVQSDLSDVALSYYCKGLNCEELLFIIVSFFPSMFTLDMERNRSFTLVLYGKKNSNQTHEHTKLITNTLSIGKIKNSVLKAKSNTKTFIVLIKKVI